jgi:predicted transcriptional regulator
MTDLLPNVRQYYAEVGVILERLLGENGSELVPQVLARLSQRSERVQSLVEHEDPFQVALEVGKKTYKDWEKRYESFRKVRESIDWRKAVQAFDQQYLKKFAADERLEAVAHIVAAHVSRNRVPTSEIKELIQTVYRGISNITKEEVPPPKNLNPAVSIERSIEPDYLICLEDGKKLKMLKRHLRSTYNLTPDRYREKWGLPPDYPMVAPRYAEQRSALAKSIGLGRENSRRAAARTPKGRV